MSRHFHVLCGLRGCFMPDMNDVCDTLPEARQHAQDMAEAYQEDMRGEVLSRHSRDYYTIGNFSVEIYECDSTQCEVGND